VKKREGLGAYPECPDLRESFPDRRVEPLHQLLSDGAVPDSRHPPTQNKVITPSASWCEVDRVGTEGLVHAIPPYTTTPIDSLNGNWQSHGCH
jgi:hypothetical protein